MHVCIYGNAHFYKLQYTEDLLEGRGGDVFIFASLALSIGLRHSAADGKELQNLSADLCQACYECLEL